MFIPGKSIILSLILVIAGCPGLKADHSLEGERRISLARTWTFQLDGSDVGLDEQWYQRELPMEIILPGSTDEAGYGNAPEQKENEI